MFYCKKCGQCCKHIRGILPEQEKKEFEELAFGKLPIIQVIPVREMSFPIWNWEYEEIEKFVRENENINKDLLNLIKPARIILDLNTNKSLIVAHCIDSDKCIFLGKENQNNNNCKIYSIRPLVCKQFPFQNGPFSGQRIYFGDCAAIKGMDLNEEILLDKKKMRKIFSDSYLSAAQKDLYMNWVNETILKLMKENKIRPAMKYPYKYLIRRYEKSEKVLFMDFLHQIGFMKKEEIEEKIKDIKNNKEAEQELAL